MHIGIGIVEVDPTVGALVRSAGRKVVDLRVFDGGGSRVKEPTDRSAGSSGIRADQDHQIVRHAGARAASLEAVEGGKAVGLRRDARAPKREAIAE